jgi:hypothetical protein
MIYIYIYIDTHTVALKCTWVHFVHRLHRPIRALSAAHPFPEPTNHHYPLGFPVASASRGRVERGERETCPSMVWWVGRVHAYTMLRPSAASAARTSIAASSNANRCCAAAAVPRKRCLPLLAYHVEVGSQRPPRHLGRPRRCNSPPAAPRACCREPSLTTGHSRPNTPPSVHKIQIVVTRSFLTI